MIGNQLALVGIHTTPDRCRCLDLRPPHLAISGLVDTKKPGTTGRPAPPAPLKSTAPRIALQKDEVPNRRT